MKHGHCARTGYGKYLRNRDLAEVRNLEDVVPFSDHVGQVRLDSLHKRANGSSVIIGCYFPCTLFASNLAMQLLKIVAFFQEFMPELNLHFVTSDAKIIELCPVSSNQAFRMCVVVSGRKSAYDAIRGQNALDVQTLDGRRGMGHVDELGLPPARNVRVGSFEGHKLVAGKTLVARRGAATD